MLRNKTLQGVHAYNFSQNGLSCSIMVYRLYSAWIIYSFDRKVRQLTISNYSNSRIPLAYISIDLSFFNESSVYRDEVQKNTMSKSTSGRRRWYPANQNLDPFANDPFAQAAMVMYYLIDVKLEPFNCIERQQDASTTVASSLVIRMITIQDVVRKLIAAF